MLQQTESNALQSAAASSSAAPSAADPLAGLAEDDVLGALRWAVREFGADLRIACSLSVEDCLLVHFAAQAAKEAGVAPTVFVLDTGRLHPETYETLERLRVAYPLPIQVLFPRSELVEPLLVRKGAFSFYESIENRKECCQIRKVEPLGRALRGAKAWVSGLRRAQSVTRSDISRVERDASGLWKVNPLAFLSDEQVWALAESEGAIIHPLHRRGFPSIGCAPCTRAVAEGEDQRAGRWWWEDANQKECGLHRR